jgi:hypothetical protein
MQDAIKLARSSYEETHPALIKYRQGGTALTALKLLPGQYSEHHRQVLRQLSMNHLGELVFPEMGWKSLWIGAGEEKAVFLVIDPKSRAFALELLGKDGYKGGKLINGYYLDEVFLPHLCGHRWHADSIFGHVFSGHVKVREYIYGETLAGPQLKPHKHHPHLEGRDLHPYRLVNTLSRRIAHWVVSPAYWRVRNVYHDTHEANVMIELVPLANPEKKPVFPLPLPWLEPDGRLGWYFIRFTSIDVRTNR